MNDTVRNQQKRRRNSTRHARPAKHPLTTLEALAVDRDRANLALAVLRVRRARNGERGVWLAALEAFALDAFADVVADLSAASSTDFEALASTTLDASTVLRWIADEITRTRGEA